MELTYTSIINITSPPNQNWEFYVHFVTTSKYIYIYIYNTVSFLLSFQVF